MIRLSTVLLAMILILACTSFFHVNMSSVSTIFCVVFCLLLATGAARSISFQDMLLYAIVRM